MLNEGLLSGLWAAAGSTFGKLSGTESVVGNNYFIWLTLLSVMVVVNTLSCRYYLRSLDASENTTIPTVVSSATNYFLSGIIGIVLFGEEVSILWWVGAMLITTGLGLVLQPKDNSIDKKER